MIVTASRFETHLIGRDREVAALDALVDSARGGGSATLVLHGAPGVGKTALLEQMRTRAAGCRVADVAAASTETDLPYAALHHLLQPVTVHLDALSPAQRATLDVVFGRTDSASADRLRLGLAVLELLGTAADDRPLLLLIDDAQWLDAASSAVLAFIARRLGSEAIALVVATTTIRADWAELPVLGLEGLSDPDARALLAATLHAPLDGRVRERLIAETGGNPAALLAIADRGARTRLAGGFGAPDALGCGADDEGIADQVSALGEDTRMLLLLAAAEPTGDPLLLWTAADLLGIPTDAWDAARGTGLLTTDLRVTFSGPAIRGAVYRSASAEERRLAHGALAAATDADADPERQAWHRARESSAPDEELAAALERSAVQASEHGGVPAAAAFLREAATFTPEPDARARRALAAAQASRLAGDARAAWRVLVSAEAAPSTDTMATARAQLVRARLAMGAADEAAASSLLMVARRLASLDPALAREAYLDALAATVVLGERPDAKASAIADEISRLGLPDDPRPADLLLDALARHVTHGAAAAMPALRRALAAFERDVDGRAGLEWAWIAPYVAAAVWDHRLEQTLCERYVRLARQQGAIAMLPPTLSQLTGLHLRQGELDTATDLVREAAAVLNLSGGELPVHLPMLFAAYRGQGVEGRELIDRAKRSGPPPAGLSLAVVQFAAGLLYNGLGRYDDALHEVRGGDEHPEPVAGPGWVLPEVVEAATRAGFPEEASAALERLSARAQVCGTDWALGLEARCRALLSAGDVAERLYREAISRLAQPGSRVDLARAHLLYGEWLRRGGRRLDARTQLRCAHEMFRDMGVEAFAARAARELRATGENVRRREVDTRDELTAQELQIAHLASEGLTNQQIGARLFLSPRTVEWHLRKIFTKLDIRSRHELPSALPVAERELAVA